MMMMSKNMRGITLIELMIVIVVLAVLVAIAYPNYAQFSARAKRNEARAALLQIATNQERFYLNNQTYTDRVRLLGFDAPPAATTVVSPTGAYTVSITAANANTFTAQAVFNLGGAEAGRCGTFAIDSTGLKTSAPQADCWTASR